MKANFKFLFLISRVHALFGKSRWAAEKNEDFVITN